MEWVINSHIEVGVDIVEIDRIGGLYRQHGQRFLDRYYTKAEQDYCGIRIPSLAGRWAAKEAVSKALGTGLGVMSERWREIEILNDEWGRPMLYLYGEADLRAVELNLQKFVVSISHEKQFAVAFVVGYF